jgi:3-deoxy-manno-octulosonate cytidylyltransferase (CMP-KDO synthetase)
MDGLDIISLADSNGSLFPDDITDIIIPFQGYSYEVIFHPHNNMQLAFANAIEAFNCGIDIIDCSFNGIGRGAGNLPTELIMSYLNKYTECKFNLKPVLKAIDNYILRLKGAYQWGYNVPNMFSGLERIHPYYGRDTNKYELSKAQEIIKNVGLDKPMKYEGKKKILCVIPARYKSSRFPGKTLKLICGKPLIKHVYDNAMKVKSFDEVFIATDDERISSYCKNNDLKHIMTSSRCKTGTDRIAEVAKNIDADLYVNVQGDEPLLMPDTIEEFVNSIMKYGELDRVAYNSMTECKDDDIKNINIPKVIINVYGDLLYMSRLPIPYSKSGYEPKYYKELGLHAYTKNGLEWFHMHKDQYNSEEAEELEFLRFLEIGKSIRMIYLDLPYNNHAVDIPEDIEVVEKLMEEHNE